MSLNPQQKINSKLIVLSAPSGTGKSTLASMLLQRHANIRLSISYTTRSPRGDEKHGTHYFFVEEGSFKTMISGGHFLEHAHVFGKHWYGTSRETVESMLNVGNSVLFDIDVEGAANLKRIYQNRCVTIFLLPPSLEELETRLRKRQTESNDAIEHRLKAARHEMQAAPTFDFRIVNDTLDHTYAEIEKILKKEGCIE